MADYNLTELQLAIMKVLWERGEATVVEVQDELREERDLAQSTVATLLSRMEKKGVVAHRKEGRQYVYAPAVREERVQRSLVTEFTELAGRLFEGDMTALVSHLLAASDVAPSELARVRALIEQRETQLRDEEEGR